jgi:hypothetical protein
MSGFVRHDYILTFDVADLVRRDALRRWCKDELDGDEITGGTWEISTDLDPQDLERRLLGILAETDRAAYYYLADAKRIFRVDLR